MQNSAKSVNGAPVIPALLLGGSPATHSVCSHTKNTGHCQASTPGLFAQAALSAGLYFWTAECVATFSSFHFVSFSEYNTFLLPLVFFACE